ncbi:MAG: hypothetical protein QM796_00380 [Chthoniobacteraceae bacterium]
MPLAAIANGYDVISLFQRVRSSSRCGFSTLHGGNFELRQPFGRHQLLVGDFRGQFHPPVGRAVELAREGELRGHAQHLVDPCQRQLLVRRGFRDLATGTLAVDTFGGPRDRQRNTLILELLRAVAVEQPGIHLALLEHVEPVGHALVDLEARKPLDGIETRPEVGRAAAVEHGRDHQEGQPVRIGDVRDRDGDAGAPQVVPGFRLGHLGRAVRHRELVQRRAVERQLGRLHLVEDVADVLELLRLVRQPQPEILAEESLVVVDIDDVEGRAARRRDDLGNERRADTELQRDRGVARLGEFGDHARAQDLLVEAAEGRDDQLVRLREGGRGQQRRAGQRTGPCQEGASCSIRVGHHRSLGDRGRVVIGRAGAGNRAVPP